MPAYDHEDCNPTDSAPATLRSGPTRPLAEVAGMRVCIEKLHIRSSDYVVAVYVGNFTRYVYKDRAKNEAALVRTFQLVCYGLTSAAQVQGSNKWTLDPDLSKGFGRV